MRTMCLVLVAVLEVSLSSGRAQEPAGTIKGTVVQKTTQEPLPGVTVRLAGTRPGTFAGEQGEFTIARVAAGVYAVFFYCQEDIMRTKAYQ